jgi:hypothetical protein
MLESNQSMIQYLNKQLNEKTTRYTSTYQATTIGGFKPSERSRSPLLNTTNSTTNEMSQATYPAFSPSPDTLHRAAEPIVYREPENK